MDDFRVLRSVVAVHDRLWLCRRPASYHVANGVSPTLVPTEDALLCAAQDG